MKQQQRNFYTVCTDYVYGFDSTEGIASSLMTTALDGVGLFDLGSLDEGLTLSDATELFERVFRDSQYTLSTVLPLE